MLTGKPASITNGACELHFLFFFSFFNCQTESFTHLRLVLIVVWFRFDLYFRKNPFGGEYTVFAGLEECIRLIANFKLTEDEISFICQTLPGSSEVNYFQCIFQIFCCKLNGW